MTLSGKTIVAISTPPGEGAIGIVRLSGPRSLAIMGRIFSPLRKGSSNSMRPFSLVLGTLCDPDSGDAIDEVFCVS